MSSLFASGSTSVSNAVSSYAALNAMMDAVDPPLSKTPVVAFPWRRTNASSASAPAASPPSPQYSPSVEPLVSDGYENDGKRWPYISQKKKMTATVVKTVVKEELAEVAESTEHGVAEVAEIDFGEAGNSSVATSDLGEAGNPSVATSDFVDAANSSVATSDFGETGATELLKPKLEFADHVVQKHDPVAARKKLKLPRPKHVAKNSGAKKLGAKHEPVVVHPPQSALPPQPPPGGDASSSVAPGGDASSSVAEAPTKIHVPIEWSAVKWFTNADGVEKLNIREAPIAAPYPGMDFIGYYITQCKKYIKAVFTRSDSKGVQGTRRCRNGGGKNKQFMGNLRQYQATGASAAEVDAWKSWNTDAYKNPDAYKKQRTHESWESWESWNTE